MSFMKEFIPGIDGEGEKDEGECDDYDDDEEEKEEEEEESFDEGGGILHPPLSMMRGRRKVDTESLGSRADVRRVEEKEVFDESGAPREEVRRRQDHLWE